MDADEIRRSTNVFSIYLSCIAWKNGHNDDDTVEVNESNNEYFFENNIA